MGGGGRPTGEGARIDSSPGWWVFQHLPGVPWGRQVCPAGTQLPPEALLTSNNGWLRGQEGIGQAWQWDSNAIERETIGTEGERSQVFWNCAGQGKREANVRTKLEWLEFYGSVREWEGESLSLIILFRTEKVRLAREQAPLFLTLGLVCRQHWWALPQEPDLVSSSVIYSSFHSMNIY